MVPSQKLSPICTVSSAFSHTSLIFYTNQGWNCSKAIDWLSYTVKRFRCFVMRYRFCCKIWCLKVIGLCDLGSSEVQFKSASCNGNFLDLFCNLLDIYNCLIFLSIYLIYLNFVSLTFGHLFTISLLYKSQIKRNSVHLVYNHDWLAIWYVWPRSCKCTCKYLRECLLSWRRKWFQIFVWIYSIITPLLTKKRNKNLAIQVYRLPTFCE